MEHFGSTLLSR